MDVREVVPNQPGARSSELVADDDGEDPVWVELKAEQELGGDALQAYLRRIGKFALLTAEQEVDNAKRIEAGLVAAQVLLVRNHQVAAVWEGIRQKRWKQYDAQYEPSGESERVRAFAEVSMQAKSELAVLLRLAVAKEARTEDLEQIATDGQRASRAMVEANLRFVVSIARRYAGRGMALLDLIQEGNVGLLAAVETFDYILGYKFSTHAFLPVRKAILRGMVGHTRTIRLPMHMVEQVSELGQVSRRLAADLGRDPTVEELATALDVKPGKVEEVLAVVRQEPVSLDELMGDSGNAVAGSEGFVLENSGANRVGAADLSDTTLAGTLRARLEAGFWTLKDREVEVLKLYFGWEGKTPLNLAEIGARYGVSDEAMRQTKERALKKLRILLAAERHDLS